VTTGTTTQAASTGAGAATGVDYPDHGHAVNDPTHYHEIPTNSVGGGEIGAEETFTGGVRASHFAATGITVGGALARHQHAIPQLTIPSLTVNQSGINPEGGQQPHTNIQPYITVFMWKRTA